MNAQASSPLSSFPLHQKAPPPRDQNPSLENALEQVLTPEARRFLISLQQAFQPERAAALNRRAEQQEWFYSGGRLSFPQESAFLRAAEWSVAPCPPDLRTRHVEITGPAEAKMMINAMNSGANVFMADLEDSLSPTWENVILGQSNLMAAARGTLAYFSPEGKIYALKEKHATLMVRPRGWHLSEKNFEVDGRPISASLFDFGLAFFHNAQALLDRGSGPYFYLPKLESASEARLWNKVFTFAQEALGIPRGTIRATVLIETITAAFEMDEILFELREHSAGLNAGRWDYLFSILKKYSRTLPLFPDRAQLTMDLPFLRSYCELLVQTCHKRGAHAIGGMSAFIPSRRDPEANRIALAKVKSDKERELGIGFDGSWVAHPDLVEPVQTLFVERLEGRPDQKQSVPILTVLPADLMPREFNPVISEANVRSNIAITLLYMHRWLEGQGAVAIHQLMEDAATAEISRALLWQWRNRAVKLADGYYLCENAFRALMEQELGKLAVSEDLSARRQGELRSLLEQLVLTPRFPDFFTRPAYETLMQGPESLIN